MNRKDILKSIIEEQDKLIDNLNNSVNRYTVASDIDEESTHDPEDFSQQTQAKDMQLRYEKLRNDAQQQLNFLHSEINEVHDKIEAGSLIETDKNYFFVGASVPLFEFNEKEVIVLSEEAPVFQELKDKSVGDTVKVGDEKYTITSIS